MTNQEVVKIFDFISPVSNRVETREQSEEAEYADLLKLGVRYLSQKFPAQFRQEQSVAKFLAALVLQPDNRFRKAFIPEFILHPEYVQFIPFALKRLRSQDQY
jgi:hypothetical protein